MITYILLELCCNSWLKHVIRRDRLHSKYSAKTHIPQEQLNFPETTENNISTKKHSYRQTFRV